MFALVQLGHVTMLIHAKQCRDPVAGQLGRQGSCRKRKMLCYRLIIEAAFALDQASPVVAQLAAEGAQALKPQQVWR